MTGPLQNHHSPETKLSPNEVVDHFFLGMGGGQNIFAYYGCCASVQTQVPKNDFARVVRSKPHRPTHLPFWGLFAYATSGPLGED